MCQECWEIKWAHSSEIKVISQEVLSRFCLSLSHTHTHTHTHTHVHGKSAENTCSYAVFIVQREDGSSQEFCGLTTIKYSVSVKIQSIPNCALTSLPLQHT